MPGPTTPPPLPREGGQRKWVSIVQHDTKSSIEHNEEEKSDGRTTSPRKQRRVLGLEEHKKRMETINAILMNEWGLTLGEGTDEDGKALMRSVRKAAEVYKSRYEAGHNDERSFAAAVVEAERERARVLQEHNQQTRTTFKVVFDDDALELTGNKDAKDAEKGANTKPNASPTKEEGGRTLFIGGLTAEVTDADIRAEMNQYGEITELKRPTPAIAFVLFATREGMKVAKLTAKHWRVDEARAEDRVAITTAIRNGTEREVRVAGVSQRVWPAQLKRILRRAVGGLGAIHVDERRGRQKQTWTAVVHVVGDDNKRRLERGIHGKKDKFMRQDSTLSVVNESGLEDEVARKRGTHQDRGVQGRRGRGRGGRGLGGRRLGRGLGGRGLGRGLGGRSCSDDDSRSNDKTMDREPAISLPDVDTTIGIEIADEEVIWDDEETTNPLPAMMNTGLDLSAVEANETHDGDRTTEHENGKESTYLSDVMEAVEVGHGAKVRTPNDIVLEWPARQLLERMKSVAAQINAEMAAFIAAGRGACAYEAFAWTMDKDTQTVVDRVAACLQDTELMQKLYQDLHGADDAVFVEVGTDSVIAVTQDAWLEHCANKATKIKDPTTGVRSHGQCWSADKDAWADTLTLRVMAIEFGSYTTINATCGQMRLIDANGVMHEHWEHAWPAEVLIFDGKGHYCSVRPQEAEAAHDAAAKEKDEETVEQTVVKMKVVEQEAEAAGANDGPVEATGPKAPGEPPPPKATVPKPQHISVHLQQSPAQQAKLSEAPADEKAMEETARDANAAGEVPTALKSTVTTASSSIAQKDHGTPPTTATTGEPGTSDEVNISEARIQKGDRVMAHYGGTSTTWIPGVVVKRLKRTFKVKFDDGDEARVKPQHIRLPKPGEDKKHTLGRTRQQTTVAQAFLRWVDATRACSETPAWQVHDGVLVGNGDL